MELSEFEEGQLVIIVDREKNELVCGTVEKVNLISVVVRWEDMDEPCDHPLDELPDIFLPPARFQEPVVKHFTLN